MKKKLLRALMLAAVLGVASEAQAAWHLYVVPYQQTGNDIDPKYLDGVNSSCRTYGVQPVFLCAADTNSVLDAAIQAAPDAWRLPDNLDQRVSAGVLSAVQNAMEARNIPSQWVTTLATYRDLLREVNGMFSLLQTYLGITGQRSLVIGGSVTLNTTMNQLPASVRNNLRNAATQLGVNTSAIAGNTPLREALQIVGEHFLDTAFVLGGITI